jgi:hypothetical protein
MQTPTGLRREMEGSLQSWEMEGSLQSWKMKLWK